MPKTKTETMAKPKVDHFERTLPLSEVIPNEEIARKVTPQDVTLNEEFGLLEIFPKKEEAARDHVRLENILWRS